MTNEKNTFLETLSELAVSYSCCEKVRVQICGDRAVLSGFLISIPKLDLHSEFCKSAMIGFLIHECAHLRFTDFESFMPIASDPCLCAVAKILEDIRIERRIGLYHEIPCNENALSDALLYMVRSGRMSFDIKKKGWDLAHCFLHFYMRSRFLKQKEIAQPAELYELLVKRQLPELYEDLTQALGCPDDPESAFNRCAHTSHVIKLARTLVDIIIDYTDVSESYSCEHLPDELDLSLDFDYPHFGLRKPASPDFEREDLNEHPDTANCDLLPDISHFNACPLTHDETAGQGE